MRSSSPPPRGSLLKGSVMDSLSTSKPAGAGHHITPRTCSFSQQKHLAIRPLLLLLVEEVDLVVDHLKTFSTVTRSKSSGAPLRCDGTGDPYHRTSAATA